MKICIYCGKNPANSSEHILQDAFGSDWQKKGILCSSCNALFGNTLDKELAEDFRFLRNLLSIKNRRGNIPETVLTDDTGLPYTRSGKGEILGKTKPQVERTQEGKQESFFVHAESKDMAGIIKNIQAYSKKIGARNSELTSVSYKSIYPGQLKGKISLGLPTFIALRKSLFNFASLHIAKENNALFTQETRKIHDFAQSMPYQTNEDYLPAKEMHVDGFPHIVNISAVIRQKINEISLIASALFIVPKEQSLYGGVVLFGSLRFGMKLFDNYKGNDIVHMTIIDPVSKAVHHENSHLCDEFIFLNLDRDGYVEALREQLAELMPKCMATDYKLELERVFNAYEIDQLFPIKDKKIIRNILIEKMGILFCSALFEEGVYYSFFASGIGRDISSFFVDIFLKEREVVELDHNEYEQFLMDAYHFLRSIKEDKSSEGYQMVECIKWLNKKQNGRIQ